MVGRSGRLARDRVVRPVTPRLIQSLPHLQAPIDPKQLLEAFQPLLTNRGGIKNVAEVPRISSLMNKFSKKLVSRSIYCQILCATEPPILDAFLSHGGWSTIDVWVQQARDKGKEENDYAHLAQLCDVLIGLPMTLERLQQQDVKIPRLLKRFCKSTDLAMMKVAAKSKNIIEKWTQIIEKSLPAGDDNQKKDKTDKRTEKKDKDKDKLDKDKKKHKDRDKDKKRLSSDSSDSQSLTTKKKTFDGVSAEMYNNDSNLSDTPSESLKERIPRPSTVKVKPGKSRLDGLVTSQVTSKLMKRKIDASVAGKPKDAAGSSPKRLAIDTKIGVPSTSTTPTTSSAVSSTPVPSSPPPPPPPPVPQKPHILTESDIFMEALNVSSAPKVVKKRRLSQSGSREASGSGTSPRDGSSSAVSTSSEVSIIGSTSPREATVTAADTTSSPKESAPKFSFYKDISDEKFGDSSADSNANEDSEVSDLTTSELMETSNGSASGAGPSAPVLPEISVISESTANLKSILCYVKKGSKKSVRWLDDDNIQKVRFFELDETERVNVNRPAGSGNMGDLKRFDMRHEAEVMQMARRAANPFAQSDDYQSRTETYSQWRLIPIDYVSSLGEPGRESRERDIQSERMRTSLETFYLRGQVPDNPAEAEEELVVGRLEPKVIPLDDINNPNNCHDYSLIDLPPPKTGEILRPARPVPSWPGLIDPAFQPPLAGIPPVLPMATGLPPMAAQFGGPPLPDVFIQNQPPVSDPFRRGPFPAASASPSQHWSDGPPPPTANHGGRPRGPPFRKQDRVCKHWAKTGKCRFNDCRFLHVPKP